MGRSLTIHCLGFAPLSDGREQIYYAMNRREIAQEIEKARREGLKITYWRAQTKTGCRILGDRAAQEYYVKTEDIKLPKMVTCPACFGYGEYSEKEYPCLCPICNGSGITTPGYEKSWRPWQIEEIQEGAKNYKSQDKSQG